MSSGFVPASDSTSAPDPAKSSIPVNDEWEAAKASIEQRRREREQASHQENAKSLYETLQANKGTSCPHLLMPYLLQRGVLHHFNLT